MLSNFKARCARNPECWVAFPLAMVVGVVFFVGAVRAVENESRQRFAAHSTIARNALVTRIKSYADLATGAAALFRSRHPVTPLEFHGYVSSLNVAENYPEVEALNVSEYLDEQQRAQFEQRQRSLPRPYGPEAADFEIKPPGFRAQYEVTTMIEPARHYYLLGSDLFHARRSNVEQLRDSGKHLASGIPIRGMSGPNRAILGIRMPTYLPRAPLQTPAQRRAAYTGSVGVAFSVPKLLTGVIGEIPVKNVRLTLVDPLMPPEHAPSKVLFDSHYGGKPASGLFGLPAVRFSTTLPVDFNGRKWLATFSVDRSEMLSLVERVIPWLSLLAGFVGTMLVHALLQALTTSRRRAITLARAMTRELRTSQARLQASHQRLRDLADHANQIKEEERKRIAREIHDDLGQNLLALRIEADILSSRTRQRHPRLHQRARATLAQIDTTIRSVRNIINDLRPAVLDLGLAPAVEWQVDEFRRRTGIACELVELPDELELDEKCSTALFRVLQESLSNVVRHAQATRVSITLRAGGASLAMTISDNGVGLQLPDRRRPGSFGLVGIEERMRILGGSFAIHGRHGMGTTVTVTMPIAARQAHAGRKAELV